jgi:hypothetical protein
MATNGTFSQQDQFKGAAEQYPATSGPADSAAGGAASNGDLSKDEVGWYFVEQYYTTLSKSPEKLHVSSLENFRSEYQLMRFSSSTPNALNLSLALKLKLPLSLLAVV